MRQNHGLIGKLQWGMVLACALLGMGLMLKGAGQADWQKGKQLLAGALADHGSAWMSAVWRRSYPAYLEETEELREEEANRTPWYLAFIRLQDPRLAFQEIRRKREPVYEEADPSYYKYVSYKQFRTEHEYLFQYGAEDTNEQAAAASPQPESAMPLEELVGGTTPAYTERPSLQVLGARYVKEQLADYDFLMKHFYSVHPSTTAGRDVMNADQLLSRDLSLDKSAEGPQILIYHTHSQETYADYGPDHPESTVIGLGSRLTDLLTAKGYSVIHDTAVYDLKGGKLDRNKAYTYALDGITQILQQNPSIQVILDLHRDGVDPKLHLVDEVNGKQTAPLMFFNGMSQTPDGPIEYLANPYREDNLAFSLKMQLDAAAYYPGLTRKIYLKGLRYNLHLRPRSALIEVGAQTNTGEEALNAMEPLAELLDMVLQGE